MMRLRDHIWWCLCNGRVVLLDALADRYFCLAAPTGEAFLRVAEGSQGPGDAERLRTLASRGLLIDDPACTGIRRPPAGEPATGDLIRHGQARPRLATAARLLAAEAGASWLLRTRGLARALEGASAAPRHSASLPSARGYCERVARASAAASLILRATDRCLVRAIAVQKLCRRQGIGARLVIGVRMDPFSAHSWVQLGGAVVVGDFEQVRTYTPILAVG